MRVLVELCPGLIFLYLPSGFLKNVVFLQKRFNLQLVLIPQLADYGGEYLTNISNDRQGEGDTNNGEEDTEEAARKGDWRDVAVANSGEDCGGEEDRLDEVPADGEVLVHHADTSPNCF